MIVRRNRHRKAIAAGLTGLVLAAGTAFAASNTVVSRNAGAGTGQIAGFTVENIGYVPSGNPLFVGQVTFTIARDGSATVVDDSNAEVLVSLDDGTSFFPCAVTNGTASCEVTDDVLFEEVDSADVVAYDHLAAMDY